MAPSRFPGFNPVSFDSVPRRSVSQTAAIGAAALTLVGGAAEATPIQTAPDSQPPPSWTVAEAVASAPLSGSMSISALSSAVPTPPVATMAPAAGTLGSLGATARWATVVGQVQPHTSAQCCFSEAAATVRFRQQPSSPIRFADEQNSISSHQFYLLLVLTLWFGATAPWILRQFWLSQQRMSHWNYASAAGRSRSRAGQSSRQAQRTGLYHSKRYRAIALDSTRATAQRFAKPRVAVSAQRWSDEGVYATFDGSEELVYETLPPVLVSDRPSHPEPESEVQPVTELYPVAV